jgi:vacuolar-type H+-ATPase subunit H
MTGTPAADAAPVPAGPGAAPAPAGPGARMRVAEPAMRAALAPVRHAMLRHAHEQAGEIVGQARQRAADAVARARAEAGDRVTKAREEGLAQAAPLAAAVRNQRRRDVRATVLAAQREAYQELCEQVRAAVSALREEPGYDLLLERLRRSAQHAAGPAATLTDDPAGGVVARGPGVVVDCSLPRLADAAVEALGAQTDWLWTPGRRRSQGNKASGTQAGGMENNSSPQTSSPQTSSPRDHPAGVRPGPRSGQ